MCSSSLSEFLSECNTICMWYMFDFATSDFWHSSENSSLLRCTTILWFSPDNERFLDNLKRLCLRSNVLSGNSLKQPAPMNAISLLFNINFFKHLSPLNVTWSILLILQWLKSSSIKVHKRLLPNKTKDPILSLCSL